MDDICTYTTLGETKINSKLLPSPRRMIRSNRKRYGGRRTSGQSVPDQPNGRRYSTYSSSSSSSSSSSESSDSESEYMDGDNTEKVVRPKRKSSFGLIQTIPGVMQYHIVTRTNKAIPDNVIRKYDCIIAVDDEDVKYSDEEELQTSLRNSTPGAEKEKKEMILRIWRWSVDHGQITELDILVSLPTGEMRGSIDTNIDWHNLTLATRSIKSLQWSDEPPKMYNICVEADVGQYVCVHDSTLATGPLRECAPEYAFKLKFFKCVVKGPKGTDLRRFGVVMRYLSGDVEYDVTSQLKYGRRSLFVQKARSYSSVLDERYFLEHELDNEDVVFESLLYLNNCVRYNIKTKCLQMEELGISKSKSKRSFITPSQNYAFQPFPRRPCNINSNRSERLEHKTVSSWLCGLLRHMTHEEGVEKSSIYRKQEMFKLRQVPDKCLSEDVKENIRCDALSNKLLEEKVTEEAKVCQTPFNRRLLWKESSV